MRDTSIRRHGPIPPCRYSDRPRNEEKLWVDPFSQVVLLCEDFPRSHNWVSRRSCNRWPCRSDPFPGHLLGALLPQLSPEATEVFSKCSARPNLTSPVWAITPSPRKPWL
jgi:hypothetical protein